MWYQIDAYVLPATVRTRFPASGSLRARDLRNRDVTRTVVAPASSRLLRGGRGITDVSDGRVGRRDRIREESASSPVGHTTDGAIPATAGIPVAPTDLVRFPDGRRRRVTTTYACHDPSSGARWWWSFLDDGTVLDQTATGDWHYVEHEVLTLDAMFARELVGPNGYLEDFEAQVRSGVPIPAVVVPFAGKRWHVATTGNVVATRTGPSAPLPGWSSLGVGAPGIRDVWFALEDRARPAHTVLGVWTDHLALASGRRLTPRRSRAKGPPPVPAYP